jgi:nucleoside 2-deoxyribosyltransferase
MNKLYRKAQLSLYLAHPFPERAKIRELELSLEKELDIDLYNPFYDGWEYIDIVMKYDKGSMSNYEFSRATLKHASRIVESDLEHIQKSDGVLAIVPYPSIGVSCEIFYGSYVLHKPVLIYQPSLIYSRYERHPWLLVLGKVYKTLPGLKKGILSLKRRMRHE